MPINTANGVFYLPKEILLSQKELDKKVSPMVLIGSSIKQKPKILKEFLASLSELDLTDIAVDFLFVDDNDDESSKVLRSFSLPGSKITVAGADSILGFSMFPEAYSHHKWNPRLLERVARLKNHIIEEARAGGYTHLFFIDSDLVLHPQTLKQLLSDNKDVVANIFWTRWEKTEEFLPQVWHMDTYSFWNDPSDPKLESSVYRIVKKAESVTTLKEKGVYRVGGLGACTLISRAVIEAGVNFNRIYNVSFWGEDRAFCIRAAVAGFELFVDTYYPAYHIYRDELLDGVANFKRNGFDFSYTEKLTLKEKYEMTRRYVEDSLKLYIYRLKFKKKYQSKYAPFFAKRLKKNNRRSGDTPKITLSMVVRNESKSDAFRKMLEDCRRYIDTAVIIDDASTDDTAAICAEYLSGVPLKIVRLEKSLFAEEHKLRKLQWKETVETGPEWILLLDADEIFEKKFAGEIKTLLASDDQADVYCFPLYDMWNETHYRNDALWNAHLRYFTFLVRYIPGFEYVFSDKNHHCGRVPQNIVYLNTKKSDLRLKHYGWSNEKRRKEKYERYMKIDGDGVFGSLEQYQSILDEGASLVEFVE